MAEAPYRVAAPSCPRCDGPVTGDLARRARCARGCGEWWSKAALAVPWAAVEASEPDVAALLGAPFPEGRCPGCCRLMTVKLRDRVTFDLCGDHGVWLDHGERERFAATFEVVI